MGFLLWNPPVTGYLFPRETIVKQNRCKASYPLSRTHLRCPARWKLSREPGISESATQDSERAILGIDATRPTREGNASVTRWEFRVTCVPFHFWRKLSRNPWRALRIALVPLVSKGFYVKAAHLCRAWHAYRQHSNRQRLVFPIATTEGGQTTSV